MVGVEEVREPNVAVRGEVPEDLVEYATRKLAGVVEAAPVPVLDVQLRLDQHADPARERPSHVEMVLDLNGRVVRAHRSAPTMTEAIDVAVARLRRRMEATTELPQAKQLRHRDRETWQRGDEPTARPEYFPRPAEERELVRRKTFALHPQTIDEAAFDLDVLDHDFFLFVNDETGEENVIARDDDGYVLMQPTPTPDAIEKAAVAVRPGPAPAGTSLDDALDVLRAGDAPFVFFRDETGRGLVVYRRYDGHYGLITAR